MGLRDIIRKKDDVQDDPPQGLQPPPEFVFIRSDTSNHEVIQPPDDPVPQGGIGNRRSISDVFRSRSRSASVASGTSQHQQQQQEEKQRRPGSRRLSDVLHLRRDVESSEHVPDNLPEIVLPRDPSDVESTESQWEKRATMLAGQNERARSRPSSRPGSRHSDAVVAVGQVSTERLLAMRMEQQQISSPPADGSGSSGRPGVGSRRGSAVSTKEIDQDIQEAIRLHEAGDLEASTRLFGRLADPAGANNPLSQVLYGLALRHGWGCAPNPAEAVRHLTAAASNAASVEQLALQAGLKKGGAAKGELVLAIFELANCFRHGWGINKDPVAAKQYYETAANLGDAGEFSPMLIEHSYLDKFSDRTA